MKLALGTFIVVALAVLGFWYYWWNIAQPTVPKSQGEVRIQMQRSPIIPGSFTEEEAKKYLHDFEAKSPLYFDAVLPKVPIELSDLPREVSKFVLPAPGESVTVAQGEGVAGYYYAHFFSDIPMPENSARYGRLANPKEYQILYGFRNHLASVLELESLRYIIRISQLTISEERTEVMIYARAK